MKKINVDNEHFGREKWNTSLPKRRIEPNFRAILR
jgi:hypothetical protein